MKDKLSPIGLNFERGFYMLCWFTNPEGHISFDLATSEPEPLDNGMGTQFFSSLEEAKEDARLLTGSWMILQMIGQNPNAGHMSWRKVLKCGEVFDLNGVTWISDEYRLLFEKPEKPFPEGTIG